MDYREFLKEAFEERVKKNPRFSMRHFSKQIEISPSQLSLVLNGRKGLSVQAAEKISERLALQERQKKKFCMSVAFEHSRSLSKRKAAGDALKILRRSQVVLSDDQFKAVADWYHMGLMQLLEIQPDSRWTPEKEKSFAARLEISVTTLKNSVARLKRLGLLKSQNGHLIPSLDLVDSADGVPSAALRTFHRQVLGKALGALESQSVDRRYFRSAVISFDTDELAEASAMIRKFHDDFLERFAHSGAGKSKSIYLLGLQFFDALQEEA